MQSHCGTLASNTRRYSFGYVISKFLLAQVHSILLYAPGFSYPISISRTKLFFTVEHRNPKFDTQKQYLGHAEIHSTGFQDNRFSPLNLLKLIIHIVYIHLSMPKKADTRL
jgi:hypothetical protein